MHKLLEGTYLCNLIGLVSNMYQARVMPLQTFCRGGEECDDHEMTANLTWT